MIDQLGRVAHRQRAAQDCFPDLHQRKRVLCHCSASNGAPKEGRGEARFGCRACRAADPIRRERDLSSRPADRYHPVIISRRCLAETRPIRHQPAPLLEQIAAPICRLDLVLDRHARAPFRPLRAGTRCARPPNRRRSSGSRARSDRRASCGAAASTSPCWTSAMPAAGRGTPARPGPACRRALAPAGGPFRAPRAPHRDNGTRCSRPAFMRSAGTVQTFAAKSISPHFAPSASPVRATVRIVNSSARADMPSRPRKAARNPGISSKGSAA